MLKELLESADVNMIEESLSPKNVRDELEKRGYVFLSRDPVMGFNHYRKGVGKRICNTLYPFPS